MNEPKEKKIIAPNECSLFRWILVLLIGFCGGMIITTPLVLFTQDLSGTFMGLGYMEIFDILYFIPLFVVTVLALRLVAKTSLRDFVLGVGGAVDKKNSLILIGLYAVGMVIPHLLIVNHISLRGVQLGEYVFLLAFSFLTIGMQAAFEEFIFRGLLLRWMCGNELRYSVKAILTAVISSIVFALAHSFNSEVASQSGIYVALVIFCYFVSGFVCFWADIHFGSLLPGILIHWVNNFVFATIIGPAVAEYTYPTLLIDAAPQTVMRDIFTDLCFNIPVILFILFDLIKRKRLARDKKQ